MKPSFSPGKLVSVQQDVLRHPYNFYVSVLSTLFYHNGWQLENKESLVSPKRKSSKILGEYLTASQSIFKIKIGCYLLLSLFQL